ncbi:hypothetical protein KAU51_00085 [Candidatus Parcubacteria bacterium]|nr:hypothetical protein [Candidatus Parcubacteria bacterium]
MKSKKEKIKIGHEGLEQEISEIKEGAIEREEYAIDTVEYLPRKERKQAKERIEVAVKKGAYNEYNKCIERLKKGEIFTETSLDIGSVVEDNRERAGKIAEMFNFDRSKVRETAKLNPDIQYKHDIEIIRKGAGDKIFETIIERTKLLAKDFGLPIGELEAAIKEGAPIKYRKLLESIIEDPFGITEEGMENCKEFARKYGLDENEVGNAYERGIIRKASHSSEKTNSTLKEDKKELKKVREQLKGEH